MGGAIVASGGGVPVLRGDGRGRDGGTGGGVGKALEGGTLGEAELPDEAWVEGLRFTPIPLLGSIGIMPPIIGLAPIFAIRSASLRRRAVSSSSLSA